MDYHPWTPTRCWIPVLQTFIKFHWRSLILRIIPKESFIDFWQVLEIVEVATSGRQIAGWRAWRVSSSCRQRVSKSKLEGRPHVSIQFNWARGDVFEISEESWPSKDLFAVDVCVCTRNLKSMQVVGCTHVWIPHHYTLVHHHISWKNWRSPSVDSFTWDFLALGSIIMFAKFALMRQASIALLIFICGKSVIRQVSSEDKSRIPELAFWIASFQYQDHRVPYRKSLVLNLINSLWTLICNMCAELNQKPRSCGIELR